METIGDLLPSAVGVAISPVPVIAVILMLGTPRARANGTAFAVGWVAGLTAVSVLVLAIAGGADDADSGASTAVDWVEVAVGVLFLAMAAKQWQARPRPGQVAEVPTWMATVDSFTAGKCLGLGLALSAVNPKNLALTAVAASTIAQNGLSTGDSAVAVAVFVVIGSVTVVGPVLFYLAASDRAAGPLGEVKAFMSDHNAVIMAVLLVVLGAKVLGQGLGGLS